MKFYAYTDKALKYLRRYYIRAFQNAAILLRSDNLNVVSISKELYADISEETERVFRTIAKHKYREHCKEDFLVGMWLSGMLDKPNELTGYVWRNDIERKRQYFAESVLSGDAVEKAVKKALRYWYQSQKQYADLITDAAALQAFSDSGTEFVQWKTADDERVCAECNDRDGIIYPVKHVPAKPHYNCRCYFRRVKNVSERNRG